MKNFILNIFLLIILSSGISFSQIPDITCTEVPVNKSAIEAQTGGKFKPSSNAPGQYFRILIVFAQFSGDTNYYGD